MSLQTPFFSLEAPDGSTPVNAGVNAFSYLLPANSVTKVRFPFEFKHPPDDGVCCFTNDSARFRKHSDALNLFSWLNSDALNFFS